MDAIEFTVPTIPIAQPRQRVAVVAGRPRTYTPTKAPVNAFKAAVQLAAQGAYDGPPLDGPLSLEVAFVLPRPQSRIWKSKPMPREPHVKRPDGDNLLKSLKDALSGLLWRDDCQVWHVDQTKFVAAGNEQPHVWMRLEKHGG